MHPFQSYKQIYIHTHMHTCTHTALYIYRSVFVFSCRVISLHENKAMTSIVDFYAGRTVLVTGATGFMGKVLLEKLLRSCPTITKIYVLIRPKKGFSVEVRLTQLLESKVTNTLSRFYLLFLTIVFCIFCYGQFCSFHMQQVSYLYHFLCILSYFLMDY